MGWRELRHGFDRQLSVARQSVGQLPGCVACQHPRAQASRAALFAAEGVDHLMR